MGKTLSALRESGYPMEDQDVQRYRLAALLHDVGHYPYSHAMEEAVTDHYTGQYIVSDDTQTPPAPEEKPFEHERVGKEVLIGDPDLQSIFKSAGVEAEDVSAVFMREEHQPQRLKLANLLSSDLDADRIDYLLRTAHHTGLPYGSVDINYILSQLTVDSLGNISLKGKALRAADHFLLSRYFDYQQVAYHKTVVGLEIILKDVLKSLLSEGMVECSASWVKHAVRSGVWHTFDDLLIWNKIRDLALTSADDVAKTKAAAILQRRPPKLIWSSEFLGGRTDNSVRQFGLLSQLLRSNVEKFTDLFGIPRDLWLVWKARLVLTKVGSHLTVSQAMQPDEDDQDKLEQSVRIIPSSQTESLPIMEMDQSLMKILSNYSFYSLRLYLLLPRELESRRGEIESYVRTQMDRLD
jgi:hypothetical protein